MKMRVAVTSLVILSLLLGLFSAVPVAPALAADPTEWVLDGPPLYEPPGGTVQRTGYSETITEDSFTKIVSGDRRGNKGEEKATFSFSKPPPSLKSGTVLTFSPEGTVSSTPGYASWTGFIEGIILFSVTYEQIISGIKAPSTLSPTGGGGESRLTVRGMPPGPVTKNNTISYTVPEPKVSTDALRITVSGTEVRITWKYRPGGTGTPQKSAAPSLSLKFYHPFQYFKEMTGLKIDPAGDLVAKLGNTIIGRQAVVFYIDPEVSAAAEPGKNLYEVLDLPIGLVRGALGINLKGAPPTRKYFPLQWITSPGEAKENILKFIDPEKFSSELLKDRAWAGEKGKVSGTVWAGVYNKETQLLESLASVTMEFKGIAQILYIGGTGRSAEYKAQYVKEDPDKIPWGPGRVRVKRPLAKPNLPYDKVEAGFLLMPGDIVDIDGNAELEIAWVNGTKAIARVPDKINKTETMGGQLTSHYALIMSVSAYESGFPTTVEKLVRPMFGFGLMKGLEALIERSEAAQVLKELWDVAVEIYGATKNIELDQKVIARIRVRSKVVVDSTSDDLKVYNIEGSPSVKTASGSEVTLANGKMVTVSDDGKLGTPQTFDARAVESRFQTSPGTSTAKSAAPVSRPTPPAKGSPLPKQDMARVAALIVVAVVVFGLGWLGRRHRSKG